MTKPTPRFDLATALAIEDANQRAGFPAPPEVKATIDAAKATDLLAAKKALTRRLERSASADQVAPETPAAGVSGAAETPES